ncbi:response regulator [Melioribacteraceae bacterium 4301-Me]|uniref:response regulator n=1 Tax=Pyranulibacter aquaticus TaxID=3163344 RepID=UPI00359B193C
MKKMLVVEDDFLSQKVLLKLFQQEFEIDVCESSDEFYQKIKNTNYDIIIMDISIKGEKSGIDLTIELKSSPKTSRIPILCLTAHAFLKDRKTAIDSGVDMYLAKPVPNDILRNAVKFLVNKNSST